MLRISNKNEMAMVGRQQVQSTKKLGVKTPDSSNESKNALSKVRSGIVTKKKPLKLKTLVSKEVQTENGDISIVTGEEVPLEYWKELSETRRQALDEALEENRVLHQRVEDLEKEKVVLEEMMEHAKHLAGMLQDLSDEENPDESGIAFSSNKTADDSTLEKDEAT